MSKDWRDALSGLKNELPEGEENKTTEIPEVQSRSVQKDPLRVELDKRNGKPATIISNYLGTDAELKELTKTLKVKCGSGGSCRDGEILIQGDFRVKLAQILEMMGYKTKKINFK